VDEAVDMTEAEQERRRARDLERRLRRLGIHCPPGTLEPLTQDAHLARSPAAVPATSDRTVAGEVIYGGPKIVRRNVGQVLRVR
jgi:hypothetical protein